jgi:hypothetical protein
VDDDVIPVMMDVSYQDKETEVLLQQEHSSVGKTVSFIDA